MDLLSNRDSKWQLEKLAHEPKTTATIYKRYYFRDTSNTEERKQPP